MTTNPEENGPAKAPAEAPQAKKKAPAGARRAHSAPTKGKSGKKASPPQKVPKRAKKPAPPPARDGSKTSTILDLLKRPGGATAKELMKTTGWQPHSLRGFISGTLRKKMGLDVTSTKGEDGERSYSVKA